MNRQLGYLDKLSCSLIEFCIKRRDSRIPLLIECYLWKTCISVWLLHKLEGRLKQGIVSKFKVEFLRAKSFPQKILCLFNRTIIRLSKSRFFDVFHLVPHTYIKGYFLASFHLDKRGVAKCNYIFKVNIKELLNLLLTHILASFYKI